MRIIQAESAECGLACIAMVAAGHGQSYGLAELRNRFGSSLHGSDLARLMSIAGRLGFLARPLRLELHELGQLRTPCILHWDLNHFVVLSKVGKSKVTVLDPASGQRVLRFEEVSKHFTGVALEMTPGADFRPVPPPPRVTARQLAGKITGLWRSLGLILALSLGIQVFVVITPFLTQLVVDQVLVSADRDLLEVLGLGFGLALLLQVAITALRGWSIIYLSSRLGLQWMGNVFAHLLKLPLDFFQKRHLGDVVSRMGSVQTIQRTLTGSFIEALIDGLMAIVTLGMMLLYSARLALITLLAVSAYVALRAITFRPVRDGTELQLVAAAKQQTQLLETIRGIQSVKVAGVERQREAGYAGLLNDTVNRDVWVAKLGLGFSGSSQLIFGIERIAVVWVGAVLALDNSFSVGMLVAYLAYKDQFASRVSSLIDKWIDFRMLRLHGERLADIVLTPPEIDAGEAQRPLAGPASIRVSGLSFRYAEGEPWVVRDCNFSVHDGESVAIVGPSGCGKTTLAKLLLGLLQPTEGVVSFGDHDIGKLGHRNFRRIAGAVMQDDQLFAGSLAENIAFGAELIDDDRVQAAAKLASIHDEIVQMPMGYNSLVGDMGTTLSGGQKQRVILARALYRKPRLLVLDEATSHLDVERERLVNQAVRSMRLTKVIIAHRPETIASADRVLVMQQGRILQVLQDRGEASPAESGVRVA